MVAAAARELRDGEVVFVGIGLPNLACNLARADARAQPRADLRVRRGGRAPRTPAALDRRPVARDRAA